MEELKQAAVSKIVIERPHKKCRVTIHSARPGIVIGKKGADIEKLRKKVAAITDSRRASSTSSRCASPRSTRSSSRESIAQQLERRVAFRRAMKRAVQSAMRLGAEGIRINCSGRLGGAEIARTEWYREGRVPLHTLRADIDYGMATAHTAYGTSASRSGSSRARSWSTIRWRGEARARRPDDAPRRGRRRAERTEREEHAATEAHQVPQGLQGPHPRRRQGRHAPELRLSTA